MIITDTDLPSQRRSPSAARILTNDVLVRAMCSTDTHAELEPSRLLQVTTSRPMAQRSTSGPEGGICVGLHLP